jgi:hypothetical protein
MATPNSAVYVPINDDAKQAAPQQTTAEWIWDTLVTHWDRIPKLTKPVLSMAFLALALGKAYVGGPALDMLCSVVFTALSACGFSISINKIAEAIMNPKDRPTFDRILTGIDGAAGLTIGVAAAGVVDEKINPTGTWAQWGKEKVMPWMFWGAELAMGATNSLRAVYTDSANWAYHIWNAAGNAVNVLCIDAGLIHNTDLKPADMLYSGAGINAAKAIVDPEPPKNEVKM